MALCRNEQTLAVGPVGRGARTSPELLEGDCRKKGKCVTAVAETQVLYGAAGSNGAVGGSSAATETS